MLAADPVRQPAEEGPADAVEDAAERHGEDAAPCITTPNRSTGILSILRSAAIGFIDAAMDRPPAAISTNIRYST